MASERRTRGEVGREQIAAAALRILDAEGIDGLTMRRLADAVGVGTMTVYGHFRNKDEVLDAAADAATAPVGEAPEGSWRVQLRHLALTALDALEAHPTLVHLRLLRPVVRPQALRFAEAGTGILRGAGLGDTEAAEAFRLLFTYTVGHAALSPERRTREARRDLDIAIAGLEPEQYPHLRATREACVAAVSGREVFEAGLEILLDGIEARLPA